MQRRQTLERWPLRFRPDQFPNHRPNGAAIGHLYPGDETTPLRRSDPRLCRQAMAAPAVQRRGNPRRSDRQDAADRGVIGCPGQIAAPRLRTCRCPGPPLTPFQKIRRLRPVRSVSEGFSPKRRAYQRLNSPKCVKPSASAMLVTVASPSVISRDRTRSSRWERK